MIMNDKKYSDEYIESLIYRLIDGEIKEEEFKLLKTTGIRSHEHVLKKYRFERRENEK